MRREKFGASRRTFLSASASAALGLMVDGMAAAARPAGMSPSGAGECPPDPFAGGVRLGTIPLDELEAPSVPMHTILGEGLDARLFTDLSALSFDTLITPAERFFVRTTCPPRARAVAPWTIEVTGLVPRPRTLRLDDLRPLAAPMGTHLIECAGNARSGRFGLISAARWSGVPIAAVLDLASAVPAASHIIVTGIDHDAPSMTSVPGASWVFSREQLLEAGAFLATGMNDAPLTSDHGAPVRLIVPGWYGCACIKWVSAIRFTDDRAAATGQMKEFAARTHQRGVPALAREYEPATIDLAAMPVRVERWRVAGRVVHKIVGIAWGGATRTPAQTIRFNPREPFVPVNGCPGPPAAPLKDSWVLWTHVWRPAAPGRYQIVLKADDPTVRTRRLDLYFYTRTVRIEEV